MCFAADTTDATNGAETDNYRPAIVQVGLDSLLGIF
jgi:hypothetical protein